MITTLLHFCGVDRQLNIIYAVLLVPSNERKRSIVVEKKNTFGKTAVALRQ